MSPDGEPFTEEEEGQLLDEESVLAENERYRENSCRNDTATNFLVFMGALETKKQ